MTNEKEIINNLIKLLDTKKVFFDQVLDITNKQKIDIETNEADNLSALVNKKQESIDKVDQLDKAFSVQLDLLKKTLNINTLENVDYTKYPELKILKQKVEGMMEIAGNVMAIEKENSAKVNTIFDNVKSELKNIKRGKVSLKAYDKPIDNIDGVYLDKKK